ncbi:MAG: hypothetical protein JXM70_11180 [Pirellulales bacterium]|nr:hypothetical protein [Pirellulales bacterium]
MNSLDKFKQSLTKTTNLLKTDIRDIFKSEGRLVEDEFLGELYNAPIKTDMGVQVADETVEEIRSIYYGRITEMSDVLKTVKSKLKELMTHPK